ncbi:Cytochrome P450 93A1 [Acorus calamus]|uniref:Cytochrome P450 93A1 n=1 Tax=Acorus calamus TaxID=4465 RepID=A0AAV9CT16_ACOCL|nr:Cytochrome P450 93A1 [Acorus calamus]
MEDLTFYLLLVTLWLASTLLIRRLTSNRRHRLPPGPFPIPLIGHLPHLGTLPHRSLHRLSASYGPIISLRLGSSPLIAVNSTSAACEVFKTHDIAFSDRPRSYASFRYSYGGPVFAFGPSTPYWRFLKKLCVSELLGSRTLDALRPIRRQERLRLVATLNEAAARGTIIDVAEELQKASNNGIIRMTTGMGEGGGIDGLAEVREVAKGVAETIGMLNLSDFVWVLRGVDVQGLKGRIDDVFRRYDEMLEIVIGKKEEERRRRRGGGSGGVGKAKDLLDILLEVAEDEKAEFKLTRENIKSFILDVFTAGSDTTATVLEWALAELINNPTIQYKAQQELDSVVGKHRLVEASDVPNLPYLQSIVKETLRLHPPVPVSPRVATCDAKIFDYDVPAGTIIFINLWSIHRDPEKWVDPFVFKPERFEDMAVEEKQNNLFHYAPFGGGRRGCPGMTLGLDVVHVTLASLVQCFEWGVEGGKEDMKEGMGLTAPKKNPIVCMPRVRLNPFPALHE